LHHFDDEKVRYLVIGAYAVAYYSEPRYTKDLDIWIATTNEDLDKVWDALSKFGAPLGQMTKDDFKDPETIYQIGIEPNRIDLLIQPAELDFDKAWARREVTMFGGVPMNVISLGDLIALKKSAGRPQDLIDIERLEKVVSE
jgi:predicted nucleotidyltransferase